MAEDWLGAIGNAIGSGLKYASAREDRHSSEANALANIALQKSFAKEGIQWKVADALKAGIHPLAALGASTTSFAPISVGSNLSEGASGFASAGQDIGRAVNASMSKSDRSSAAGKAAEALALEKGQLENDLLRTQLASQTAKLTQAGGNPAMPKAVQKNLLDGQGNTPEIGEEKKFKDRPKMMMGGKRVLTDPLTSNMESTEDRYGDEGPVNWGMQLGTAWNDLKHNVNSGNLTREDVVRWMGRQLKWVDQNTSSRAVGNAVSYIRGRR